nr:hypothetical protein CFP56_28728 [Quercus suber]
MQDNITTAREWQRQYCRTVALLPASPDEALLARLSSNLHANSRCDDAIPPGLTDSLSLQFASVVDVSRVPLCLALDAPYEVSTTCAQTQDWFASILAQNHEDGNDPSWWQQARASSPLGVLVSVSPSRGVVDQQGLKVTEILFYASRTERVLERPPTPPSSPEQSRLKSKLSEPVLKLYAQALSSDFYHHVAGPTPPTSPDAGTEPFDGVFMPFNLPERSEIINEPPVRKRKSAADRFAEQTERIKKARHEAARTVSARHSDPKVPTLKHSRSISGVSNFSEPESRSPSVSRPASVRGHSEAPKRSSLSHVQAALPAANGESIEGKNKELISRMVMAGMRFHGLSQSKPPRTRPGSPVTQTSFEDKETARKNDEEYKAIYHQVYKAICFTFRKHVSSTPMLPYGDTLREVVDKFLAVFCSDPLAAGLPGAVDEYTPGGRKAFGASMGTHNVVDKSPFLQTGKT